MMVMEWLSQFYWEDYKYYITIPACLAAGFLAGYWECKIQQRVKDHEEAVRLAVENTIG